MAVVAFDTHPHIKNLTSAGFSEAQAEAMASLVTSSRQADGSELATKGDVASLKSDISVLRAELDHKATKADLGEFKADILKWMIGAMGFQTFVVIAAVAGLYKLLH